MMRRLIGVFAIAWLFAGFAVSQETTDDQAEKSDSGNKTVLVFTVDGPDTFTLNQLYLLDQMDVVQVVPINKPINKVGLNPLGSVPGTIEIVGGDQTMQLDTIAGRRFIVINNEKTQYWHIKPENKTSTTVGTILQVVGILGIAYAGADLFLLGGASSSTQLPIDIVAAAAGLGMTIGGGVLASEGSLKINLLKEE